MGIKKIVTSLKYFFTFHSVSMQKDLDNQNSKLRRFMDENNKRAIRQYADENKKEFDLSAKKVENLLHPYKSPPLTTEEDLLLNEMTAKREKEWDTALETSISAFKQYSERREKYDKALIDCEFPPFYSTTMWNINDIVALVNKHNNNTEQLKDELSDYRIQELECDKFKKLDRILNIWLSVSELSKRKNILSDIVKAHKTETFTLSIPITIIQIEGILVEYSGSTKQGDLIDGLKKMVDKKNGNEPLVKFFEDIFYHNFYMKKGIITENSRHAIIHGVDCEYASKINSVRMIHLLDYVINLVYREKIEEFLKSVYRSGGSAS
ncbi:hypothetical protein ACYULU_13420 [Breznakiellaceae bacterium SP9]